MRIPLAAAATLRVFLLLSAAFFSASVLASPMDPSQGSIKIVSRQTAGSPLFTEQACQQYSRIANLSVIGSNSTMRTTFLDVSPAGTLSNSAMLNEAIKNLPMLTADAKLNEACGNLTTVATTEAANNFTKGIVAQFTFTGNHASIVNGPVVAGVVIMCLVVMLGPISAL
ncbi:hypothetical protein M406DRAFT_68128 [Cryphonectria parasitica EP155]|uniref:Metal tolerance protein 3 protein n=1 Tax=Cryphonectria parasitica (strain ATCC 38755 / EP155) TaxID=660469 RepID=A0A9P5CP17_CRYP1|nr:uncharacterized protein M406DRAFT_68128 [Cryphonectria parasitica EP155]KAF3765708.1 hypothetical protein M406DRAFT_68128 [Cryphonectria parasitica EP155]